MDAIVDQAFGDVQGIDTVLDRLRFSDLLAGADLALTGEGRLDGQTEHGKVVDPACLKCLDCVSGCPSDALAYGFTTSAHQSGHAKASLEKDRDFSRKEEGALVALFALALGIFIGLPEGVAPWAGALYGKLSLFLSVTLAVITALVALLPHVLGDVARVALGNSITLTPGTITLDIQEDGEFHVHALSEKAAQSVTTGDMESRIGQAFLEPNKELENN